MNNHSITFFILTITTALLLSGCWDVSEPQRMYYVQGVGVDYKDKQYEVYLELINLATVAKSDRSNPQETPAEIGKANRSIDQEVFWGHMNYLILSERVMQNEHAIPVIDTFIRFRETRYQIWVYCTEDPIEDILLTPPVLDKSLTASKLSDPENTSKQLSFIEPLNLRKAVIGLNEPP